MDSDRRSGFDRRNDTGINSRMLVGNGARRTVRRQEDRSRIFFVDQYSPVLFLTIVAILFLCAIDALLTLYLLENGGHEVNPIMAFFLKIGPLEFFIFKYVVTCIATFGLFMVRSVVIRRFNVSVHTLLHAIAWAYLAVVGWELYLVYNVV